MTLRLLQYLVYSQFLSIVTILFIILFGITNALESFIYDTIFGKLLLLIFCFQVFLAPIIVVFTSIIGLSFNAKEFMDFHMNKVVVSLILSFFLFISLASILFFGMLSFMSSQ